MSVHYHPIENRGINRSVLIRERPLYPAWQCRNERCAPSEQSADYQWTPSERDEQDA